MSGDKHPARPDGSKTGEQPSSPEHDRTVRDRVEDGRRCLQAIGGPDYDGPLKKVAGVSPDMADLLLAFPYGDVMSRPGLSLRHRQICTVAMLLAHRSAQAQLRFHMRGLLNVGGIDRRARRAAGDGVGAAGLPAGHCGRPAHPRVDQRSSAWRLRARRPARRPAPTSGSNAAVRRRSATLLHVAPAEAYVAAFAEISPALAQWTVEFEFGDVLGAIRAWTAISRHLASLMMLA